VGAALGVDAIGVVGKHEAVVSWSTKEVERGNAGQEAVGVAASVVAATLVENSMPAVLGWAEEVVRVKAGQEAAVQSQQESAGI
jgi:hypothetical protein